MSTYTVTDDQIRALRQEAGQAGDTAQVALCTRALEGSRWARGRCATAIRAAQGASGHRSGPTATEARRRELGTAQLKVRLPLATIERLKAEAGRRDVSLATLVATAIDRL